MRDKARGLRKNGGYGMIEARKGGFIVNLRRLKMLTHKLLEGLSLKMFALILLGAAISTFGIHHIHQRTGITEGGVIGLVLLTDRWFGIPPSIATPVLDVTCYLLALRFLGARFLKISAISTLSVTLFYSLWEHLPYLMPDLSAYPLAAALLGGASIGVGVGLIVRQGGSAGGDDALALTISHVTRCRISRAYLATDLTVLTLSLSYIPLSRIAFSLVTVTVSSLLIDFVQNFGLPKAAQTQNG